MSETGTYVQGYIIKDSVYLNADQLALALHKLGWKEAADGIERHAQRVAEQIYGRER